MVVDVSRQINNEEQFGLITRDFLGRSFQTQSNQEFDLDMHVPCAWDNYLHPQSEKVYMQRCHPAKPSSEQINLANKNSQNFHISNNFLKSSTTINPILSLFEQPTLELNLLTKNSPTSTYTSVCTLDKVKSALERSQKASPIPSSSSSSSSKKRSLKSNMSPSWSNNTSLLDKRVESEDDERSEGLLVAGACPKCLLYVLISKNDPKCPKCSSVVDLPHHVMIKKPKIDLNI